MIDNFIKYSLYIIFFVGPLVIGSLYKDNDILIQVNKDPVICKNTFWSFQEARCYQKALEHIETECSSVSHERLKKECLQRLKVTASRIHKNINDLGIFMSASGFILLFLILPIFAFYRRNKILDVVTPVFAKVNCEKKTDRVFDFIDTHARSFKIAILACLLGILIIIVLATR